jgi:hypothetical protein
MEGSGRCLMSDAISEFSWKGLRKASEKPQSGLPVSGSAFEPGTLLIPCRNGAHSTA